MLVLASKFLRQIVPPVIATLIAAVLIAGFNRAFSTHLTQPRMAALHNEANSAAESAGQRAQPVAATAVTQAPEAMTEPAIERLWDKDGIREAAKDQIKTAEAVPAPGPARRTERVAEIRPAEPRAVEPRQAEPYLPAPVAAAPVTTAPIAVAPVTVAPPLAAAAPVRPEAVVVEAPMVTVPDRPRPLPPAQIAEPPQGPIGTIVNTLKPSSLFARAREFGEKIEAAGNEILPSIRQ
jgi:hypothetical protein